MFQFNNPVLLLRYWHVTNWVTNSAPRITGFSHKLKVAHFISKVTASYGARFVTVFTKAHHQLLSWASWIQWHFHTLVMVYSVALFFLFQKISESWSNKILWCVTNFSTTVYNNTQVSLSMSVFVHLLRAEIVEPTNEFSWNFIFRSFAEFC